MLQDNITFTNGEMQEKQNISLTAYVLIALANANGLTGVSVVIVTTQHCHSNNATFTDVSLSVLSPATYPTTSVFWMSSTKGCKLA